MCIKPWNFEMRRLFSTEYWNFDQNNNKNAIRYLKSYVEIFSTFFPFPKFVICHRILLLNLGMSLERLKISKICSMDIPTFHLSLISFLNHWRSTTSLSEQFESNKSRPNSKNFFNPIISVMIFTSWTEVK